MRTVLLIHPPDFEPDRALAGASLAGLDCERLHAWEQIDTLTLQSDGNGAVRVCGLDAADFAKIVFVGYPRSATANSTGLGDDFFRAEWVAGLDAWIHSQIGKLVNRPALRHYLLHQGNRTLLLDPLVQLGWSAGNSPGAICETHLVLSRWKSISDQHESASQLLAAVRPQAGLEPTWMWMRERGIELLFIGIGRLSDAPAVISASLLPPPSLSAQLWQRIWNDFPPS